MRLPRDLVFAIAIVAAACARVDATPTIAQANGGNGAPVSNAFAPSLTSAPPAGDLGILAANCTATMTTPTGWTVGYASTHVGTSNYFAVYTKTLAGAADQTASVGCSGIKDSWTFYDLSAAGIPTVGTLVSGTSSATAGPMTYTVPKAGGLILELYEGFTASGSAATGITDSASVTTTASANSGSPGVNAEILFSFFSAADPFSGVTQPYSSTGTWNHSNSVNGSVDVYIAPPATISQPAWWPPPFDRIQ